MGGRGTEHKGYTRGGLENELERIGARLSLRCSRPAKRASEYLAFPKKNCFCVEPPDGGSRYVPLLYLPRVTWQGSPSLSETNVQERLFH